MKIFTYKTALVLLLSLIANIAFGQSGSVFRDFNANGTKDTNEPLVSGVLVKAYNSAGALCASATSGGTTSPNYTLPTTCTGQVRVEFEIPATGSCNLDPKIDYSSFSGSTNGTSVQFISNTGTANFAISDPSDYNSSTLTNPKLFTTCYVSGNNLGTGNVGAADAFISINYNPTGNSAPSPAHYSNSNQIGATWGVAYSKQAKKNFTSAVLKRHSGFGPLGSGGIYMIDPSKQLPDLTGTTQFLDFDAIGIPTRGTGTYAGQSVAGPIVPFSSIIGTNTERGLGTNLNSGERDAQALAQSGRVSFGDIDVSDDGRYLYVMNLYDKKLYEIDLTDPQNPVAPTSANKATKIKSWSIPEPCDATKGTARPWSIGYYRGKVYIGIVCDGNISQTKADLNFSIHELNTTSGVFNSIFTNTLDFPRGLTSGFASNGSTRKGWFGWTDDWNKLKQGTTNIIWPQPILSDIEFDSDGSFILGFIDRSGLQGGWNNKSPITNDNSLYLTVVGGDLLRAYKKPNCQWELESAGKEGPSSPKAATGGATNGEGPGGGEFYYEEFFATQHRETALGGLAISFGSGDVVSTIYDPFQYDSFGIGWFDNATGKKDKGYEVFATGNNGQTPTSGTFSKGLTLGDLEIEAELPPLEIGNRVWLDTNNNGIQDAGENSIANVTVELYDGATLVGTTTTSASGNYYFNNTNVPDGSATAGTQLGVQPNTTYTIKVGAADWTGGIGTGDLKGYLLTKTDATPTAGLVDFNDNDASLVSTIPTITYKTGDYGQNNHTLDIGFSCTPTLLTAVVTQATCTGATANSDAKIEISTSSADKYKITAGATSTAIYATATALTANAGSLTAIANPASATQYTIRVFNGSDACFKDTTVTLQPKVCALPPCSISLIATPSACNVATNTYNVTGTLTFANAPATGTLTVSDGTITQVFNAPFTSTQAYSLAGLTSDGASHSVTAIFSATPTCTNTITYTAPVSCACPAQNNKLCAGESYTLTAQSGMTGYQWYSIVGTDTTAIAGATAPAYTSTTTGTFIWKAKDANGCDIKLCCPVILTSGNCYGSIGDYVWTDTNNDGQQAGEAPIQGVKVYLLNGTTGAKLDSTTTDATGKYLFDSLATGSYKVQFVAPAGTIAAKQNTGADVTDSDANKLGLSQLINIDTTKLPADTLRNNPQIDAGFVPVGSIGDYVFEDLDKSNTQTAGDMPLSGVKVYLLDATTGAKLDFTTTDLNGKYLFDSLIAGNYKVQFVAPSGTKLVTQTSGTDLTKDSNPDPTTGITATVNIDTTKPIGDPLRDNRDVDAGIQLIPSYGSLGDYVWTDTNNNGQQDGTEAPIAGVKVYLYDATGTTKLDSAITDINGKYLFDSLLTGGYKVKFVAPAGTIAAKQNTGADVTDSDANKFGWSQIVNIDASKATTDTLRNNPQIDAGFVPVGSIGDYVFNDKDNSNTQTAGDLPIEGVKVYLLDATTGAKLDSTLTDATGLYKFDSLVAGNYKVKFEIPVGMLAVTKTSGGDSTKDSNINPDGTTDVVNVDTTKPIGDPLRDITQVDAGLKGNPQYGSIGDYVWFDVNNDGQQAGETPIQGVKVYLYDATGTTKLDSTLTDATGKYLFDSLLTGGYKVKFVAPTGTFPAKQNLGSDVSDSDANKLGWSQVVNIDVTKTATDTLRNNPQIDAGFVPFGSLGDYVFEDKDNSNTQTAGDLPVNGVKVYLLDATTGAKLDSTITDGAGKYLFDSLVAGNYKVQFVAPAGTLLVTKATGGDPTKDSNPDPTTGITDAVNIDTTKPLGDQLRDITTVDAGIKAAPAFGSIGDYVWTDTNNNGQQDGTEAPIAGVKVYLYDASGTTKLDSAITDINGKYLFESLLTGGYKVKFIAPTGTISAKQNTGADLTDSDANKLGWSQVVNIDASKAETDTLRNNPQIDAGFVPVGSIGDYVFKDKDNSNTQTAGDLPIEGVKVYLLDATTGAKLDSTFTDTQGLYKFDSLVAGNYKVKFEIPVGMLAVTKTSGGDPTKDSNINPDGTTDVVNVDTTKPIGDPLREITQVDAGLKGNPQYGSIGDYVWFDVNNDGQQAGEAPIQGVKVFLYDATGTTKLDSTLTDATGKYLFDSLLTGGYKVKFVAPTGTFPAKQNIGADVTDSDANKLGWSQVVNIDVTKTATDTLRNNPQIDAGFVPFGSLGDYVFEDKDNSNTQSAGDLPVSGVKIYLLDATTGAKLDSTITDGAGKYLFDSLVAGNYKVQFVAPAGTLLVTKATGGDPTKDSNPDPTTGITDAVNIDTTKPLGDPLRDITTVDAGIKAAPAFGSIGDYVWTDTNNNGQQDGTEAPIAGVKVYLYDASGTTKLDSTLTDVNGKYLFDSLLTGGYKVQFVAPTGTISAKQNTGADVTDSDANKLGWSQVVNIDVTKAQTDTLRNNPQIDAGFVPVGSIGDYVFNDKDNSNTQTAGDLPIEGVKVYLLDGTTGAKLDSTFTNTQGLYKFDSLVAGNYKVQFVVPVGMTIITKDSGTDDKDSDINPTGITDVVTVDTTKPIGDPLRDITTVDAGLKGLPQYGSIGDYVWYDVNNDGQQAGEAPIQGVKVYLYDASGTTILDSTVTDVTGKYLFDSLFTGGYKVKFIAPDGTFPAKQNIGADISDSDANKLGWSQVVNIDVTKTATDTLRNNPQIDAGFVPFGSLGDYVFEDKDNSNTQTPGDKPIACIKVYLLDATTGAKLDSTMTDISGKYLFDSLVAGNYKVQFVIPAGGTIVTKTSGTDVTKDSNPDPTTGITDAVNIDTTKPMDDPLRDNRDVDAGLKLVGPFGSIGDYVWFDVNNDGQQAGEAPIQGVKIYLYDGTGTVLLDSTITDIAGKYLFDSLMTGDYKVKFVAPIGSMPSKQNIGSDLTDNDANKLGWSQLIKINTALAATDTLRNNPNIDAGFVPVGSIGDYVFEDKDNSNTQTAGDLPISGMKVYLIDAATGAKLDSTLTDAAGKYLFDSLVAGIYKVQFVKPAGTNLITKTSGADVTKDSNPDPSTGITDALSIDTTQPIGSPARDNRDVDAGIKPQLQYGSLGDYVWYDLNNDGQQGNPLVEKPIAGVKVYLYDASGTTKLDSTVTDINGKYLFDSLLTGSYKVYFKAPIGTIPAKQNIGIDVSDSDANKLGWSQVVNIDASLASTDTLRNNPQIDAGFIPVGSIGDYVFNDKDNSNTQTAGDLPIQGVKVYLLDATSGAKLDSTVTDAAGLYKFDSLLAGNYKVQFVVPAGMTIVTKDSGSDLTDSDINPTGITDTVNVDTTLPVGNPARDVTSVDAGLKGNPQYGSLGDYVWYDVNNDGQQGDPLVEKPIAGVKVFLYDATGMVKLDSTVTDATGKYLFDSLLTGAYKVKFVAPTGTFPAKQNISADVTDSDANKLGWSQIVNIDVTKTATDTLRNNPQIDAGFVPFGSLGDYVFNDKDNSNTQTAGDLPLGGVKVYLLDATTGAKLDSTITDGAGKYLFDSLVAGNYKVQFIAPNGTNLVTKTTGADVAKDSNPDPATGITDTVNIDTTKPMGDPLRDNRDVDAGIKAELQYGSLGDYVWYDLNNDGQQGNPLTEKPIAGVKVYLYDATGATKLDSTFTDINGKYLFDSLLTGSYKVYFKAPVGTIPAKQNIGADVSDSDANKLGWSQVVNIEASLASTDTLRNNPQIDAGFIPVGSIGDYVFNDKDNSNTQTAGDLPIQGVKVYLLDATSGTKLDSTVTDAAGLYKFDSLLTGNYKVKFVVPVGMTVVTKNIGGDPTKDSNINPDGTTDTVDVDTSKPIGDPLRDITQVDAGLKGNPQYGSIGDYVWYDVNNDGQQGTALLEKPIAGVKVFLYDATGTVKLDSTVTDATGKYLFDSLLTGAYKVKFEAPVGTFPAKQNIGADVSDSDANKAGWSQVVNIDVTKTATDTLRNNPQIDAGFVPFGSIGDYVFNDKDGSNTQTVGDLPMGSVKVYLLDATTGAKLDSTVTDGAGKYLFDSLVAGNYKVQFIAPSGTDLVLKTIGGVIAKDSNPDPTTGITDAVNIDTTKPLGDSGRDNRDVDAGIKGQPQYGSLGDYVWLDTNNDGQQLGETPISGVEVRLYDATGTTLIETTFTDASGKYKFDSLLAGDYKVRFIAPAGTIASKQNLGADVFDSDANKLGWSQVIKIDVLKAETDTLRNNPQIDAGFVPVGSIGDYVFEDKDNSNTQTLGDTPVAGVKVYILNSITGAKLDSTLTDGLGKYLFDSLLAGNYKVQFIAPLGRILVTADSGDDTKDSDANTATGITAIINVDASKPVGDPTRNVTSVDAGLKAAKVDLSIKKSADGNCKRRAGESVTFKIVIKREDNTITDVNAIVKDSLSSNFQFVSAIATEGTYNNATGLWTGINLAKGDSATLTILATIKNGASGLVCNDAWIMSMDKEDVDSFAGNKIESEDDFARACVSVPVPLCAAKSEKVELTAPTGYASFQWFKNGQIIVGATNSTYLATTIGDYSVTVNNGSCPANACCPIYVEDICDCPPVICVPFVIQKTKSK